MITLKGLLTEKASIFSLSDSDPWEYKYDLQDTGIEWWTRKKGTDEWVDMQMKLSPTQYQTAVQKLRNAIKSKTTVKSLNAAASETLDSASTENTITAQDIADSNEMDKVWNDVLKVFVGNPDKYFGQFSSWFNDREAEAADWIIAEFDKAWGPTLKKLEKSKSPYMISNVKEIKRVVDFIGNKLIRAGYSGNINPTYYYVNSGDTKWNSQVVKFRWDYM